MSYLVLARRWRPRRFHDLVGQDVVVRTLKNAFSSQSLAHAYLLTGIRGVGKTTIARLMAMAVNCMHPQQGEPCGECEVCLSITQGNNLDIQEMDAASHTGVDDIREILDGVRYPPVNLQYKVYIIDEAHMLSKSAFNALLKTLEEPPRQVLFILATTESEKLPITVRSRCQRFDLRRLSVDEISQYLAQILQQEGVQTADDALQQIARAADGSVRDALSLTERVLAYSGKQLNVQDVQTALGLIGPEIVRDISDAVAVGDAMKAVRVLRRAASQGYAPRALLLALSELWHELTCAIVDTSWVDADDTWLHEECQAWTVHELDLRYQVLVHGLRDLILLDEQRGAEMILMRLCHLVTLGKQTQHSPVTNVSKDKKKDNVRVPSGADAVAEVRVQTKPVESVCEPVHQSYGEQWQQVLNAYTKHSPHIAAQLEHVICVEFAATVHLLLEKHQQKALLEEDRKDFADWLGREVIWEVKSTQSNVVAMETVSQVRAREAENEKRHRWLQAEQNQVVQTMVQQMGFRLVDVSQLGTEQETE